MRANLLLLPTFLLAASGCGGDNPAAVNTKAVPLEIPLQSDEKVLKMFGGEEAFRIIQQAKSIEGFRVDGDPLKESKGKKIDGYEILSGPVAVSTEHARELAKILADPEIYGWMYKKSCGFHPGVAIRFTSEVGSIDILLCFECDIVAFFQNGKDVGGEDFDSARGSVLGVIKDIFPLDKEIQALKSKAH